MRRSGRAVVLYGAGSRAPRLVLRPAPAAAHELVVSPLWTGWPLATQRPGALPMDALHAPWTSAACVSNGYSVTTRSGNTIAFQVRRGDQPPKYQGGDRCQLNQNDHRINGNGPELRAPEVRFYRFDVGVPADFPYVPSAKYMTAAEWHGLVGGQSGLKVAIAGGSRYMEVVSLEKINGVDQRQEIWDTHPLAPGTFHSYIVELRASPDPNVGYFRIYRDGKCRTCGDPRADSQGRVWRRTARTDKSGKADVVPFSIGNYRDKTITVPTTILFHNVRIGTTYQQVAD